MVRENYLFLSGLFQFQPVVLWRSIEQALMSYWHFNLSAYAPCLLCHLMNSRGSGLGVCFHITLCQFLNCSSVSLVRDFFELLTSSVPGCSAQCQPAKFSVPTPNTWHPSCPTVLSGKASGCPHLIFLPPNSSYKPWGTLLQATGDSWVLRIVWFKEYIFSNKIISLWWNVFVGGSNLHSLEERMCVFADD